MLRFAVGGELVLEGFHLGPENEIAAVNHAVEGLTDRVI
jgi:hypothetical protein